MKAKTDTEMHSANARGATRWWVLVVGSSILLAITAALLALSRHRAPRVIPSSPPEAVRAVVEAMADNQPRVLWDALPPSYQADIREVISVFCAQMDPEMYRRMFRILGKAVKVLKEKEDYFARSPVALSTPLLESSIGRHWRQDVAILEAIAGSELSSLESLRQMDPGKFLASTGHTVMAGLEAFRVRLQSAPGPNPWEKFNQSLKQSGVQFVPTTEGRGYLKFTSSTNNPKEVALTRVDGRWVPTEMAVSWKEGIARAKEGMVKLGGPEFERVKPTLNLALAGLEGLVDSLGKADSQKEFDEKLKSFATLGSVLHSLRELQKPGAK
jgi:hypothetical protein